jgi:hypothetical protein
MSPRGAAVLVAVALGLPACAIGGGAGAAGGGAGGPGSDGGDASASGSPIDDGAGGHGCFATESTCDGKCVDLATSPAHCGQCGRVCAAGADQAGACVGGECLYQCAAGFADDGGVCRNFFGAHEDFPAECPGCATANAYTATCGCPSPSTELTLAVQADCPGVPMRSAASLRLCVTHGVSPDADFGGAYQVDDLDGWCGATAQCRVGNPLASGACACPAGFSPLSLRSIIRLPCNGGEVGTQIVVCGNPAAPFRSYAGAFQTDDFEPTCRIANPWTGGCSCPAGSVDRGFRVMVDGAPGLYGSVLHLCAL